jgi:hypothetical protein
MVPFSLAESIQPTYNLRAPYLPIFKKPQLCKLLFINGIGKRQKFANVFTFLTYFPPVYIVKMVRNILSERSYLWEFETGSGSYFGVWIPKPLMRDFSKRLSKD